MSSQHKTGSHPFYIGMYIHIYTHIYVHIYTSQKECLHIFSQSDTQEGVSEVWPVQGDGRPHEVTNGLGRGSGGPFLDRSSSTLDRLEFPQG